MERNAPAGGWTRRSVAGHIGTLLFASLALATPAAAQFGDAYLFVKAVKDKDGGKATELLDKPGTTVVNARDGDTGEAGLHIVTKRSDAQWTAFLLQKGADPNTRDRDGNTALLLAAQQRWSEGVRLLLLARAQVNTPNRLGETALLRAVQNRDSNIAKQLLDAGANPDQNDNSGVSPRSLATTDPRAAAVARLFKDIPVRGNKPVQGPSL